MGFLIKYSIIINMTQGSPDKFSLIFRCVHFLDFFQLFEKKISFWSGGFEILMENEKTVIFMFKYVVKENLIVSYTCIYRKFATFIKFLAMKK